MNPSYKNYLNKVVKIKRPIFEDGYLDEGMLAVVTGFAPDDEHCDKIFLDLSRFHDHNVKMEQSNYWDSNHVACLTASQAGYYPKDHKDSYYIDKNIDLSEYLEIVEDVVTIRKSDKTKKFTQEEIRLQIAELMKDCSEVEFMKVVKVLMGYTNPVFLDEKCERGFRLIEIEQ